MILSPYQKPPIGTPLNRGHRFAKGLAGLWLMNEMSGDRVWDYSGNGNHGTCMNMSPQSPTSGWGPGPHGGAVYLDGGNDSINCGNNSILDCVTAHTLLAYINPALTQTNNYPGIIGKQGAYGLYILNSTKKMRYWHIVGGVDQAKEASIPLVYGTWQQVAVVWQGGDVVYFYINGIRIGTTNLGTITGNPDISAYNVNIGNPWASPFAGFISNSMLYNRALSDLEIAILYARPYCMFEDEGFPAWMVPSNIPVFMNHYRQMMAT